MLAGGHWKQQWQQQQQSTRPFCFTSSTKQSNWRWPVRVAVRSLVRRVRKRVLCAWRADRRAAAAVRSRVLWRKIRPRGLRACPSKLRDGRAGHGGHAKAARTTESGTEHETAPGYGLWQLQVSRPPARAPVRRTVLLGRVRRLAAAGWRPDVRHRARNRPWRSAGITTTRPRGFAWSNELSRAYGRHRPCEIVSTADILLLADAVWSFLTGYANEILTSPTILQPNTYATNSTIIIFIIEKK